MLRINLFKATFSGFLLLCLFCIPPKVFSQCTGCTTTISSNSSATIEVDGSSAKLCITGGTFSGSVTLKNGADMCIGSSATFSASSMTFSGSSLIDNHGTWSTAGFALGTTLNNFGSMSFSSALTINSTGTLNSSGTALNINTLQVDGDFNLTGNATVAGSMTINGSGDVLINDGELTVGGSFSNNGDVSAAGSTNCGQISVAGASVNQGNYGTDDSAIDFCDGSGSDDGFDLNNGTVGGSVTNCTCAATLPVELAYFEQKHTQDFIELLWATVSENNSDYFSLEKSTDGKRFTTIANLTAQGSSQALHQYEFLDVEPFYGISYYRLKQVDLDGTFTYSKVIQVILNKVDPRPRFKFDPTEKRLLILNNAELTQSFSYSVYGANGQALQFKQLPTEGTLLLANPNAGVYIVRYQSNTLHGSWKFVVQ